MEIICYGCGRGENPENTIEGIIHCQNTNPNWRIEMDVQLTKDGVVILFHDTDTERITGIKKAVNQLTLAEIQQLNAGYYFKKDNQFPYRKNPLKIPTLEEVCAQFSNASLLLDVHTDNLNVISKIITIIEQHNMSNSVVIVSQYDTIIAAFKKEKPTWKYGAPTQEVKKMVFSSFLYLDALFPLQSDILLLPVVYGNRTLLTKRVINHAKKRNKKLWVWLKEDAKNTVYKEVITIASKKEFIALEQRNVDGVFTEYPKQLLLELL